MKKVFSLILSFLLLFLTATSIFAVESSRSQKKVIVSSSETIEKDFFLAAGDLVMISGKVMGDVIVGAGELTIDGVIEGDLLAVGGVIHLSGEVTQDVRVAGGDVRISGSVGGNVIAVGGSIDIAKSAEIKGGVLVAGGVATINGLIGGDLLAGIGMLTIGSVIEGDAEAAVETLILASGAQIGGDLTYYSDEEPLIDEAAIVSGETIKKDVPEYLRTQKFPATQGLLKDIGRKKVETRFLSFVMMLVLGSVLLKFFPNYISGVSSTVRDKFWPSMGKGFLLVIGVPIASFLLLISIVGIPFSLLALTFLAIVIYLSKIFIAVCLGEFLFDKLGRKKTKYLPFALGLIGYYALRALPIIGGLTGLAVMLLGLGAFWLHFRDFYSKASEAKLI